MTALLSEAKIYSVTVFGDGAMIKSVLLVNVLAAEVNSPFALLDIVDCTNHCAMGGKKDAKYIAEIVQPLITRMELELDVHNKHCPGIVDLPHKNQKWIYKTKLLLLVQLSAAAVKFYASIYLYCSNGIYSF